MTRELDHPVPNADRRLQHGGHTIPRSRTQGDRYVVRRGGLTDMWLVEDTHAGIVVGRAAIKQLAVQLARELNESTA